jgi:hypothetical protein
MCRHWRLASPMSRHVPPGTAREKCRVRPGTMSPGIIPIYLSAGSAGNFTWLLSISVVAAGRQASSETTAGMPVMLSRASALIPHGLHCCPHGGKSRGILSPRRSRRSPAVMRGLRALSGLVGAVAVASPSQRPEQGVGKPLKYVLTSLFFSGMVWHYQGAKRPCFGRKERTHELTVERQPHIWLRGD